MAGQSQVENGMAICLWRAVFEYTGVGRVQKVCTVDVGFGTKSEELRRREGASEGSWKRWSGICGHREVC